MQYNFTQKKLFYSAWEGVRFTSPTTRGEPGTRGFFGANTKGQPEGGKVLQCYYQRGTWDRGFFSADTYQGAARKAEGFSSATTRGEPGTEASLVLILRGNQKGERFSSATTRGQPGTEGF